MGKQKAKSSQWKSSTQAVESKKGVIQLSFLFSQMTEEFQFGFLITSVTKCKSR